MRFIKKPFLPPFAPPGPYKESANQMEKERISFIEGTIVYVKSAEDIWFWVRMYQYKIKLHFLSDVLYLLPLPKPIASKRYARFMNGSENFVDLFAFGVRLLETPLRGTI